MSKAFVNEDSTNDALADDELVRDDLDEENLEDEGTAVAEGFKLVKNYMTPFGEQKLKSELEQLLSKERPKLVETIAWAASNGDRSENADYIYGKRRLREIDKRVRFLHKRLEIAEIVDPEKQKADRVLFGASVLVRDENSEERVYKIVGIDESDAKNFCVSWNSPFGKALLQAKVGDVVTVKMPKGEEELEVLRIEYKKIF
jgi:transcription elongation factor GreB